MTGTVLTIKFIANRAFICNEKALTLKQLGLPPFADSFKSPAYWTVRVLSYSPEDKRLFVMVLSYNVGECTLSQKQLGLSKTLCDVDRIAFKSIDTNGLLNTLRRTKTLSYTPPQFKEVKRKKNIPQPDPVVAQVNEPQGGTIKINESFFVPLTEVRFKLGCAVIEKKFEGYYKTLELEIENLEIREEFDAIKNYFANVLKTKKIKVNASIVIEEDVVTSMTVTSPQIRRINKDLIDNVKFEFVRATIKKKIAVDIDKSLFTMDEYFDTFANEKFTSNTFYQDAHELFDDILKITNTKHYKNLRFLSGKHAHDIMKLRFVHKPFSFIFLIEGERNFHIIWETLNTEEASYVWHVDKDVRVLKRMLRKIEDIINVIKVQGKVAYINSNDDAFQRVFHDYSDLVDGFVRWKGELENILT